MSSVPFAIGEGAVAQAARTGHLPKPPSKRRTTVIADRKLAPEPR